MELFGFGPHSQHTHIWPMRSKQRQPESVICQLKTELLLSKSHQKINKCVVGNQVAYNVGFKNNQMVCLKGH